MPEFAKKGFSLIELLIVIVIIGILVAIAAPKFANTKEKALEAALKSDLRTLTIAEEAYFGNFQTYTNDQNAMHFTPSEAVVVTITDFKVTGWSANTSHPATSKTCEVGFGSDSIPGVGDGVILCQ